MLRSVPTIGATDDEIVALIKQLDFLPLAISHAVAYMLENEGTSIGRYLSLLRKENEYVKLLGTDVTDERRSPVRWSVTSTWGLAVEALQAKKPLAVELLSVLCFLDRQGIPEFLLQDGADHQADDARFTDSVLGPLERFRFLRRTKEDQTGGQMYEVHALVHRLTAIWVSNREDRSSIATKAFYSAAKRYPPTDEPVERICETLRPHVTAVLDNPCEVDSLDRAQLLHDAASYELSVASLEKAEEWALEATNIRRAQLGLSDIKTLYSMNNLAMVYHAAGKSSAAVDLQEEVVQQFKEVRGQADEETWFAMNLLSMYYLDVAKWEKAKEAAATAVQLSEGSDSQITWALQMTLAEVHKTIGNYEAAQGIAERVLLEKQEARRSLPVVEGPENPLTDPFEELETELTLAKIYCARGLLGDAMRYATNANETMGQLYGIKHPAALRCQLELVLVHKAHGQLHEAERLGRDVMNTMSEILGKNHPDTLTSRSNLAWICGLVGKLEEAETMSRAVATPLEKIMGGGYRITLLNKGNLAMICRSRGKLAEAAMLGEEVLRTRKAMLGSEHPDVLLAITNLAQTYLSQGRHRDVWELLRQESCGSQRPEISISQAPDTGVSPATSSHSSMVWQAMTAILILLCSFWFQYDRRNDVCKMI